MAQKLTTADKTKREAMAVKLLENREASPTFLSFLWTSDEAQFNMAAQTGALLWLPFQREESLDLFLKSREMCDGEQRVLR